MDLNLDSISVSRVEEAGVKPRMEVWAWARKPEKVRKIAAQAKRVMASAS